MTKRSNSKPEATATEEAAAPAPGGKLGLIVSLMRSTEGASIADMVTATGWQPHSIRGAMAGTLKKKHGFEITSAKQDGQRRYRIAETAA